ncbi:hypothetical protein TSUD_181320 [Trifolium subterraneum]|uniref:DUF4283 domain-containing protein n=1 Tax=Trifolium subterraneum TaxID=3900 RepID=A0A2Z6M1K5_TRISU|nr:hypothetical protein TSUD_181320 [Trifolium subterraneum]
MFWVPLHIWSFDGFKKIIWRYRKLMNLDRETIEQTCFDVARAQIEVSYWEMVDEVIEVKVEEENFIIRMVEERFGCIDVGVHKDTVSNIGVGESEGDSVSWRGIGGDGLNDDVRLVEDADEENESVNNGEMEVEGVVGVGGVETVDPVSDGNVGTDSVSSLEHVKETEETREADVDLGSQGVVRGEEVEDEVCDFDLDNSRAVLVDLNGPNSTNGPLLHVSHSEEKQALVNENGFKRKLKGSTSRWAASHMVCETNKVDEEFTESDEIEDESSSVVGENCEGNPLQLIPISNLQVVLNEGEVNREEDDHMKEVRLEAERIFNIGMNLGVSINEERLLALDRMVELERRDEKMVDEVRGVNFVQ